MTTLTVALSDRTFVLSFPYNASLVAAVKSLPVRRFDPTTKAWTVPASNAVELAALLAGLRGVSVTYANGADTALSAHVHAKQAAIVASRQASAEAVIPAPAGQTYKPYQTAGILAALARINVLYGDEMGLGKTVEAIGLINADASIKRVLVICPASLVGNWARIELPIWLVRKMSIATPTKQWVDADIVVINYDILHKFIDRIHAVAWDLLICDESHYLKTPTARRTKLVIGRWDRDPAKVIKPITARRKAFLTGTPIPNRPVEGWTTFHFLAPDIFPSWKQYVTRYCAAYQGRHGWEVDGASHLDELQEKLRASILIRRLKKDVLTELPPKRRVVRELPVNGAASVVQAELDAYATTGQAVEDAEAAVELAKAGSDEEYEAAVARLREAVSVAFTEMSKLRHQTALAAVPQVIDHLQNALDSGVKKVICFAWHHDVMDAIGAAFPNHVRIDGSVDKSKRQDIVAQFQNDPSVELFIGQIQAAGVGITLTASDYVVFAELDWVPGNVTQAEDRAHRIGQRNAVLVEHLVLEGSLGCRMAKRLVEKQIVIDAALDDEHDAIPPPVTNIVEPVTARTTRKSLAKEAETPLPTAQVAAIHEALRALSSRCDGARLLDGAGFNGVDSAIGKSLAASTSLSIKQALIGKKLVTRYQKQVTGYLGADAVAVALGKEVR